MKNVLKNVSFVILLLKMSLIFGQGRPNQKIIVIDPGHGGKDSGAVGINGIQEKDVVLNIAKEILKLNKNLEDPLDIYLTRYKDTLISLSDRTKLAKTLKADLFVSLHCNHSDNLHARGVEVYVANSKSKNSAEFTWFAFQMQAAFKRLLGFESRGVKFGNYQVLRKTINSCSSILVELGFLSNEGELGYLDNSKQNKRLAYIIINSLKKRV